MASTWFLALLGNGRDPRARPHINLRFCYLFKFWSLPGDDEVMGNRKSAYGYLRVPGVGWFSVTDTDTLGLSGNWTEASGTILGASGTEASFAETQLEQVMRGYSCILGYSEDPVPPYTPQPYPPRTSPLGRLFELTATPTIVSGFQTVETNNLTDDPITCISSSPDCTTVGCL